MKKMSQNVMNERIKKKCLQRDYQFFFCLKQKNVKEEKKNANKGRGNKKIGKNTEPGEEIRNKLKEKKKYEYISDAE